MYIESSSISSVQYLIEKAIEVNKKCYQYDELIIIFDTYSSYMISSKCFEALMIYPHTFLDEPNHNNTRWMFWKNVENKKLKNLKGNKTFSGTNCILINKENVLIGHEGIS